LEHIHANLLFFSIDKSVRLKYKERHARVIGWLTEGKTDREREERKDRQTDKEN
jgi:hypothetical protein